jgi:hypothetical protein
LPLKLAKSTGHDPIYEKDMVLLNKNRFVIVIPLGVVHKLVRLHCPTVQRIFDQGDGDTFRDEQRLRAPSHTLGDASRYFFFFAMQTIGAAILFWCAVPLFKQILLDPGRHVARPENLVWSLHPAFGHGGAQLPASGDS